MKMQDKEFDDLFRSKLHDFEAAPTSQVWDGVVEGIDGKRSKKTMVPYLSIAASIIVLIAAGILFNQQKQAVTTKPPVKVIAKTGQPATVPVTDSAPAPQQGTVQPAAAHGVSNMAAVKHPQQAVQPVTETTDPATAVQQSPVAQQQQPVLLAVQQKQEVISPVVPDNNTPLVTKPAVDETPVLANRPGSPQYAVAEKPKRKAHGIGGFLNAVIATVDKRKEKIIEFKDTDDEETNVMSINLGILKSKRETEVEK
ncbi:hypothetical protein [Mucilaginibacter xinganensis]|uniref:Uncharacterized protein n=1 Tax=Mucilaginibacter xinganensis TaxID=1234841 RepID=A0A223NQD8_9SPHI|nr:hypothetical protein [Mucilaginibacter xinganensis]ASU32083.1 hypothetical protein MuYL_0180 [Mucilaginibacter xinganensis]